MVCGLSSGTITNDQGHLAVWNLQLLYLGNIACIIYDMFTHELESAHGL